MLFSCCDAGGYVQSAVLEGFLSAISFRYPLVQADYNHAHLFSSASSWAVTMYFYSSHAFFQQKRLRRAKINVFSNV